MSSHEVPLTDPHNRPPQSELMQWENGQQADAYTREGDVIEWGQDGLPDPAQDPEQEIIVTTESDKPGEAGKSYIISNGQIIDKTASEESGEKVAVNIAGIDGGLSQIVIGKEWNIRGIDSAAKVQGVLIRRKELIEPTVENPATWLSGDKSLFQEMDEHIQVKIGNIALKEQSVGQSKPEATPVSDELKAEPVKVDETKTAEADTDGERPRREKRASLLEENLEGPTPKLAEMFAKDPVITLSKLSKGMFDTYRNRDLGEAERSQRLDTFFKLIATLDRQTFPDGGAADRRALRGYVPDGFTEGGFIKSESGRGGQRVTNHVDTYNTLSQHKKVFERIFAGKNYKDFESEDNPNMAYQFSLISQVALEMNSVEDGKPAADTDGNLTLSEAVPALSHQKALRTQLILQAVGVRSRLSRYQYIDNEKLATKGDKARGEDFVGNMVTVSISKEDKRFLMLDVTHPQFDAGGNLIPSIFDFANDKRVDNAWEVEEQGGGRRKYAERERKPRKDQDGKHPDRSKPKRQ